MNIGHEVGVTAQQPGSVGHIIPTKDNVRMIPKLDGVSKHYRFAKTIVGDGAGTITLRGKLSDIDATVKLLDGEGVLNRLYVNLNDSTDVLSAGTLTVEVNEIDNYAIYDEVVEILVSGDLTDLELGTLFARFNGTECAKFQPFYISYQDDSQSFEFDFTKAIAAYVLPEGFEFKRNIVLTNINASLDGTEPNYKTISLGLGASLISGDPVFYRITITNHTQGKLKVNGELEDSPWFGANGVYEGVITDPGSYISTQSAADGDRFAGDVKTEIYNIPNALLLQSPSANLADDFEPMVQRGDGHWVGTKNYFGPSNLDASWDVSGRTYTKNANAWGGLGENWSVGTIQEPGDWQISYDLDGSAIELYTRNETDTGNTPTPLVSGNNVFDFSVPFKGIWFDSNTALGESLSRIKLNPKVTLSDYLLKRYQIEQAEAAIAAYQAKNKSRYITNTDSVDDHIAGLSAQLGTDYYVEWEFVSDITDSIGFFEDAETANDNQRLSINNAGDLVQKIDGAYTNYGTISDLVANSVHRLGMLNSATECVILLDGQPVATSGSRPNPLIELLFKQGTYYFSGKVLGFTVIDHESPLPLGQGGQSFFMPLDDEPGTIAANKLGLDKKGNIVAKDGAASVLIDSSDLFKAGNATLAGDTIITTAENWSYIARDLTTVIGQTYVLHALGSVSQENGLWQARVWDSSDGFVSLAAKEAANGNGVYLAFTATSTESRIAIERRLGNVVGDTIQAVILDVYAVYGYGEWQGLPADFSSTELYTRNEQGAYVSATETLSLSAELQRQHDLSIVEKQIEKQLAKAEKSMVLAELDGVNDYPSAPEKTLTGDFDLTFWVNSSDLSSDVALNDSAKFALDGEEGYSLIYIDNPDGLEFLIGNSGTGFSRHIFGGQTDIFNGFLNQITISKRGLALSAFLNEAQQIGSTITIEDVPITIECSFFGGFGRYLSGHAGPILIKDYADPNSSSFYVYNPAGYLEDKLHTDGSMDGVYNGMPADFSNIQKWTKKGDDWLGPASNDLRPSLYGASENLNFTVDGNRVRVERITGVGWGGVSMRVGGETIAQDFYVGVTFNEVIGGDWKINNNEAVYNQSLQSSQIITSRDNGFIIIEDRTPVLGEVLDATYTVKKVIKGA